MPQEIRLDAGKLGKAERTPQGGARIPASLTRAGLLTYRNPDGTTRVELYPPEEAFRADSLATLRDAPVIIGHTAWVNPSNFKSVSVGTLSGEPKREDGDQVGGMLTVQDADALKRVDSGELSDTSLGYSLDYDPSPGVYKGQRYDGVQRNRKYNHVALVAPGGARAQTGFRFDSTDELSSAPVMHSDFSARPNTQERPMKIRLDGKDYDLSNATELAAFGVALEKLREDSKAHASRADVLQGKVDGLSADVTRLDSITKDTTRFDAAVTERVELESKARSILGAKFECKGKTNRELQVAVIRHDAKDYSDTGADGKPLSDERVLGRFETVVEKATRVDSIHSVRGALDKTTPPTVREDSREPKGYIVDRLREANNDDSRNAWRTPRAAE